MILYVYKNNTLTHPDLHFICLIFVDIKPAITGLIKSSPSDIQTTGSQNPQQGNGCVPKLMCLPKFMCAFEMTKNNKGFHINYVTTEVIWVSDRTPSTRTT